MVQKNNIIKNNAKHAIFLSLFFTLYALGLNAQVGINTDNSDPDPSAMLDVKSTEKGVLIPRMTTAQRTSIISPAKGLLVFDEETNGFWFYDGSDWQSLSGMSPFVQDTANNLIRPDTNTVDIVTDDFVFGSPQLGDVDNSNHDQRFFFDKSKGAFRAGDVKDDSWDDANVGDFSVAFGKDTKASGKGAFAIGRNSIAAGQFSFAAGDDVQANQNFSLAMGDEAYANNFAAIAIGNEVNANGLGSVAMGFENTSPSAFEMTMGLFATEYTPNNPFDFDPNDRLFTIGNGTGNNLRSDALQVLKNGNTFINGALTLNNAFTFPTTDGTIGQVLVTDGNGSLGWSTVNSSNQSLSLNNDTLSLTNGGSVDLSSYLDNTDNQSLSLDNTTLSLTNGGSVDLSGLAGADNLGNHTATQNLLLNGNWISNDGDNEGVFILNNGNVGIGNNNPSQKLVVNGDQTVNGNLTTNYFKLTSQNNRKGKVLTANADGTGNWTDNKERVTFVEDNSTQTIQDENASGWVGTVFNTGDIELDNGDVVLVQITFAAMLTEGSGDDPIRFRIHMKQGLNNAYGGTTASLENFENNRGELSQVSIQHLFTANVAGGFHTFRLQVDMANTDDDVQISHAHISVIKF